MDKKMVHGAIAFFLVALVICPATAQKPGWENQRINLSVRNTDINAALEMLTSQAGLNIVSGPQVKGTVSVRLDGVPLGEALNAILNVNGFGFIEGDKVIKIVPLEDIANAITKTYPLNYADAASLEKSLDAFVSDYGNVKGDKISNSIIVTDVPDNLRKLGQLIEQLDRRPYQVLIEVHVVDLKTTDMTDVGVDWSLLHYDNPRSSVHSYNAPDLAAGSEIRFGIIRSRYDLDLLVRALTTENKAQILSSPRVMAVDHQMSEIHVGQEVPYSLVSYTEQGPQVSTNYRKVGTLLQVTPHVTHDGNIRIELNPEQSFVTEWRENVPVIDTRTAKTVLLLGSGQTAVIGGLKKSDVTVSETKVPILGSIPLLGTLFRDQISTRTDIELIVLVTPTIIEGSEVVVQDQIQIRNDQAMIRYEALKREYGNLKTNSLLRLKRNSQAMEVSQ
jgi:type IV pilus assembly protein PilQ